MTMHLVAKTTLLSTILKTAETLKTVDELPIKYSPDGWHVFLIDPAHVAMVRMTIGKESFESYEADTGLAVLNIKTLKESVGFMPIENTVDVEFEDYHVTLRSGKIRRKIRMLDDSNVVEKNLPDFDYACVFALNTADLAKILSKTATLDAEAVSMVCGANGFKVSLVSSDSVESMDYIEESVKSQDGAEHVALYPREYLAAALPALPQNVMIGLDTDFPITISATSPFPITYILAPRIERE